MYRRSLSAAALLTFATMAGCHLGIEKHGCGAAMGATCAEDADCADDLVCGSSSKCVPGGDTATVTVSVSVSASSGSGSSSGAAGGGGAGPDASCTHDGDCYPDELCSEGACVPGPAACGDLPDEAACAERADCEPVYAGVNCTCSGNDCVCESFVYAGCADADV